MTHPRGGDFDGPWLKPFPITRQGMEARKILIDAAAGLLQVAPDELITVVEDSGFWPLVSAMAQAVAICEAIERRGDPLPPSYQAWRQVATCYREKRRPRWKGMTPCPE